MQLDYFFVMKKFLKFYILTFVLFSNFAVFAQPGLDDGGGGLGGEDPVPAPIDSKLILLGIVGIAFVLYTFRKNRKIV